jgi:hypothetical protein
MANTTTGITSRSFASAQIQPPNPEDAEQNALSVNRDKQGYVMPDVTVTQADCGQQAAVSTSPDMTQSRLVGPARRK